MLFMRAFSRPGVCLADEQADALSTVKKFCDFEFNGFLDADKEIHTKEELIYFSKPYQKKIDKTLGGLSPYWPLWGTEPLDVIDSYKIGDINLSKNGAIVAVVYRVIARRNNWTGSVLHRDIDPVVPKDVRVQLHLELHNGKWQVVDPDRPRVSKQFLASYYRCTLHRPPNWFDTALDAQLMLVKKYIDNVLLLDSLK
jgi:hypothetical protein